MTTSADESAMLAAIAADLKVVPREALAGSKRAVRVGNTVYVSPAMYDLIQHADEAELKLLLEKIEVLQLPEMPGVYTPLPMTTRPPDFAEGFTKSIVRRFFS